MILSPCYLLIVSFLAASVSCELKGDMLLDGEDAKGKIKERQEGKENTWWEEKGVECWKKEGKEKWLQTGSVRFISRDLDGVWVKSVNASVCLKRLKIFVSENVEVMNVGLGSLGEMSECCVVAESGVMGSVAGSDGGMVVLRNVSVEGAKKGIVFVGSLVRVGRCDGSDCGCVDLREGVVRDVKVMMEGTLVASCSGIHTVMEQMAFVNVSRAAMKRQMTGEEKREKWKKEERKSQRLGNGNGEKMIGCVVEGVEWPLDGGIVYGASRSGQYLWCENTTMERCERNGVKSNYEEEKNMERKTVSSGDETFVDCSFFETSATSSQSNSGGAILFTSTGKLTVVRTSFEKCHAVYCGGAISSRFDEYCKMEVEECNFTHCWSVASGGAIDARYVSEGRWVKCRYVEGNVTHMGGGLFLEFESTSNIVNENEFVGNKKIGQTYYGGAGLVIHENSFAFVTDCIFMNGHSEKNGGGICWDNKTGQAESKVLFCFFGNNSAANGGSDVYICDGWTSIDESSFVLCRTISEGEEMRVVKGSTCYSGWVLKGYFSKIHIDGEEGIDHLGCGSGGVEGEERKGRGCKRIGYFRMVADLTREVNVIVGRGRCKEEKVEIGDLSVSLKGVGKEETSVVLRGRSEEEEVVLIGSGSGMFEGMSFARVGKGKRRKEEFVVGKNGGELQLVKCQVREASAEEKLNEEEGEGEGERREGEGEAFLSGFVLIVGGRVVMESVEMSGMREDGCGVVEMGGVNGEWVEMKNTVVKEVVRERGNGSVVGGRVGEGGGVVVEGGTYRNCGCLSGSGGWMWIGVGEGGVVSIGNTTGSEGGESESAVSVEGCSCGGEGEGEGFGGGLFVEVGKGWRGLEIMNAIFSGCVVGEGKEELGRGGGLYIDVVDGGEGGKALDGVDVFQIGKVRFEGNRGWEGRDVFVRCSVLGEVADRAHLGDWFVPSEEEREEDWKEEEGKWGGVWGCERSTAGDEFGIPIVVYLWEGARERMHVDGVGGGDFGRCGFAVAPCETIAQAIRLHAALMKEQGMEEIRVSHSSLIEEAMVLSENEMPNGLVIVGDEEGSEVAFGGEKRKQDCGEGIKWRTKVNEIEEKIGFVRSSVPFSLTNIKIMFGEGMLGYRSFVLMEDEKCVLMMKGCRMEGRGGEEGGEIGFVFVEGMMGELKVEECVFKDCLLGREHLVVGEGMKSVVINGTLFSGIEMGSSSLIGICGGSVGGAKGNERNEERKRLWRENGEEKARVKVWMEKSNFTNITSRGESGAVIGSRTGEVMGVVDVRIEGCEMRVCVNEGSEEGGGVKWRGGWEENGEGLVMESCTVAGCECCRTSGRGGGIMLDCVGRAEGKEGNGANGIGGFAMRGISFLWNEAFVGKDMFVRCLSIEEQMKRSVLELDTEQDSLLRRDAANASDEEEKDVDLLEWLRGYQSVWVYVAESGKDGRLCGSDSEACRSVSGGMRHMERGAGSTMWIVEKGVVMEKTTVGDVCIRSWKRGKKCIVSLDKVDEAKVQEEGVVCFVNESEVVDCVFEIGKHFEGRDGSVLLQVNGTLVMTGCTVRFAEQRGVLMCDVMRICGGVLEMRGCVVEQMECGKGVLVFGSGCNGVLRECMIGDVESEGDVARVDGGGRVEMKEIVMKDVRLRGGASCVSVTGNGALNGEGEGGKMRMWCVELVNVSVSKSEGSVLHGEGRGAKTECVNCSFGRWGRRSGEGSAVRVKGGCELEMEACMVDGTGHEEKDEREEWMNVGGEGEGNEKGVCRWNESAVEVRKSAGVVMETRIANCGEGGMSFSGGSVKIAKSEFEGNGEGVAKYPSARRNMWCREGGKVEVVSLRGGDGMEKGSSMWMVNEGCEMGGILAARESVLFIPQVEKVEVEEVGEREKVVFVGELLLPCNLSFKVEKRMGEEAHVEKGVFEEEGYISEGMVLGWTSTAGIGNENENAEVSVCILFGNAESPSSTKEFILKNGSEIAQKEDERIVEKGKEGKSYWLLIVCVVVVVILLVVIIVLVVRWKKVKERKEELEEIVNDNIRKDPKAFEMVTMEMSPEEQWRRAEREAEKKNEERIKKRVYAKSLGHSESSEHLLSESGSTEYILGRDSDKIPEWMLEKVDDEEETRKRTPSPSISSTSTTDTSDTESTFVRREDLCPTTSSMSNLVDAMACSSPHEKLIVDLRDSLFMLLHGRNEKKEMAIGTLQEREMTAAQILFWVANLALHSFEDEEDELSSLANLSPHIVLFSEHMVICIALHSDCSSSDSDSSSISSSTVVTSTSDCSTVNRNGKDSPPPSSAFEDEDDNRKECMRWKAPEMLINKKMGATKESVVFSIGIMLWECLTLEIPFGEYEAEVAGQKIVNGERPDQERVGRSKWKEAVKACVSSRACDRPTLMNVKRACVEHFPANAAILTVSDAIGVNISGGTADEEESEDEIGERSME
ncbi:uncharacterized protein MONOS_2964 [Monocercomonoides exilis]|uniref:uncharacterized protein n=1 Tax=Monocercomonoides exilis TaxID=2049356 RepID=UPI00355AAB63|nr:hypothetical protein MONOS_2964 [Monocercomonoides exilis]|eukprot:MONOS_2964.1-p1 / transcript=MONOS_2964.1 / gene=MONOS_2964 / organism=Monocercomonoides_exilis_PA203 / gene_product=unspecified product / transcript_product=unspecified product / location=Mono_scaffold00065:62371-69636(-) / protein_length=2421 / sequence_SO=supercontig / SO=protein_coding / is_pseudo=false